MGSSPLFNSSSTASKRTLNYLPYTDIIKAAGVRLPAHLAWCGAVAL